MRIGMLPVKERFPLKRKVMTVIERRYALWVMKKDLCGCGATAPDIGRFEQLRA
jgi:hypothetical protein